MLVGKSWSAYSLTFGRSTKKVQTHRTVEFARWCSLFKERKLIDAIISIKHLLPWPAPGSVGFLQGCITSAARFTSSTFVFSSALEASIRQGFQRKTKIQTRYQSSRTRGRVGIAALRRVVYLDVEPTSSSKLHICLPPCGSVADTPCRRLRWRYRQARHTGCH